MRVHFSSDTDEWPTPLDLYLPLLRRYRFTLDPCATPTNAKAPRYFTRDEDGLAQPWAPHRVWCNPPYGRAIGRWVRKAYDEAQLGALVVMLVPSRTDTRWWQQYVARASEVSLLRGRLTFEGADHGAPFPSAVVLFEPFQSVTAWAVIRNGCASCHNPLLGCRLDALFCSPACRQRAYRRRARR